MNQIDYIYDSVLKDSFGTFPFFKPEWKTGKSKKTAYILYEIKEKTSKEELDAKSFKSALSGKTDFFEIIEFSESEFSEAKAFVFQRLKSLNIMTDPDKDEKMSLESLKGLLVFLHSIENFRKPVITLNDLGYFQLNWKKDRNNLLTVNFKENYYLNYVIFMPSHYTSKRIILNGSMNIFDFKNFLFKLGVKLHKECK